MNFKKYQPILEILVFSTVAYLIHKLVFLWNDDNPKFQHFHFPIEFIYTFFCSCSIVILWILIQVKSKSIDDVGNALINVNGDAARFSLRRAGLRAFGQFVRQVFD